MAKGRVKGVLSVTIYITLLEDVNRAMLELGKLYSSADICNDDNYIFIEDVDYGTFYSEPPVYYTSNGDGHPGDYEDDLPYYNEDEAIKDIEKALKSITYEIDSVSYERVYDDEEY